MKQKQTKRKIIIYAEFKFDVERIFSLCGDLSAQKQNPVRAGLMQRVFLKMNSSLLKT
jgi:hypothetical protein